VNTCGVRAFPRGQRVCSSVSISQPAVRRQQPYVGRDPLVGALPGRSTVVPGGPATVGYWQYLATNHHVPDDVRYIPRSGVDPFFLGAAEGTSWPLGLDDVESALASRFPGIATRRDRAVVADQAYLIFDTPVGDRTIECMYVHHVSLTVSGCEPIERASILNWFLPLVPQGTLIVA